MRRLVEVVGGEAKDLKPLCKPPSTPFIPGEVIGILRRSERTGWSLRLAILMGRESHEFYTKSRVSVLFVTRDEYD